MFKRLASIVLLGTWSSLPTPMSRPGARGRGATPVVALLIAHLSPYRRTQTSSRRVLGTSTESRAPRSR